jgi:hypothetical protein
MRAANWKHSDRYLHCKANCQAARCGTFGYKQACEVSGTRELTDHHLFRDSLAASARDEAANRVGRDVAAPNVSVTCEVGCA